MNTGSPMNYHHSPFNSPFNFATQICVNTNTVCVKYFATGLKSNFTLNQLQDLERTETAARLKCVY